MLDLKFPKVSPMASCRVWCSGAGRCSDVSRWVRVVQVYPGGMWCTWVHVVYGYGYMYGYVYGLCFLSPLGVAFPV